jgi:hypothetical protein
VSHREMVEQRREDVVAAWGSGSTIAAIAKMLGVRRAVVNEFLEAEGLRDRGPDAKSDGRAARRAAVLKWIREHPGSTLDEVAGATGFMRRTVATYVSGTPEAELLLVPRNKEAEYSEERMLQAIWDVWSRMPKEQRLKGLSKKRFAAMAPDDAPSTALYEKRFRSWSDACLQAGARAPKPSRDRYWRTYTDEQILDAVREFLETSGRTSFHAYTEWAMQAPGRPSGALIIGRLGRWNTIRKMIMLDDRKSA